MYLICNKEKLQRVIQKLKLSVKQRKNDRETEKGSHMSYKVTKCFILANREKLPKSTY